MKQYGFVVEKCENSIKVRVDRESSCGGNCVSCKGCPSSAVILECNGDPELQKGDRVLLVMPNRKFYGNLFLGYGQIIIWMVAGAVLGYCLFKSETASVLGLVSGLAVGLVIARFFFGGSKKIKQITAIKADK